MKSIVIAVLLSVVALTGRAENFNWDGLQREQIDLKLPLLTVEGNKGVLACAYLNIETCNKTGEACAIVSGVKTHSDMLEKPIVGVSKAASALGIEVGMSGAQALEILR
jgi:uncharacterized protein YunC (DUF1805 family)